MEQFTFVSLAFEPWNSPWLSRQFIMSQMSGHYGQRVLHVVREPRISDVLSSLPRLGLPAGGVQKIGENLYELRLGPLHPTFYFLGALETLSRRGRIRRIRGLLDRLGWDNRILYAWNPHYKDYVGQLGERLSVFHIHDYHPDFDPPETPERAQSERDYAELVRKTDLVFPCSDAIAETVFALRGEGVQVVENGVDYELFEKTLREKAGYVPEEMARIPRPRIAHIGRLGSKVDYRLLTEVARARPDWSVVLMGPLVGTRSKYEAALADFRRLPNAHYVEGKDPRELPHYMNAIDVGVLSYQLESGHMARGFPIKMFQYLACGKPALSAPIPSILKYQPLVSIARGREEWIARIGQLLAEDGPEQAASRRAFASRNSWRIRAGAILDAIARRLQRKS